MKKIIRLKHLKQTVIFIQLCLSWRGTVVILFSNENLTNGVTLSLWSHTAACPDCKHGNQSVCLPVSLSIWLSICLSPRLSMHLSRFQHLFFPRFRRPSASRLSAVYPSPPFIYLRVEVFRCLPSSTMPCSGRQGLQMRDGVLRSATWQRSEQIDFLTD